MVLLHGGTRAFSPKVLDLLQESSRINSSCRSRSAVPCFALSRSQGISSVGRLFLSRVRSCTRLMQEVYCTFGENFLEHRISSYPSTPRTVNRSIYSRRAGRIWIRRLPARHRDSGWFHAAAYGNRKADREQVLWHDLAV